MTNAANVGESTIQIWWVDLEAPARPDVASSAASLSLISDASLLPLLDPQECERAARFRRKRDRKAFVRSHAALRFCLADLLRISPEEVRFRTTDGEKPALAPMSPTALDFSLSHSEGMALIGMTAGGRIGVDVERRSPSDALALARRWFAVDEVAWLEPLPPGDLDRRFLECWTRKESYLKALGVGLSGDLSACRCELASDRDRPGEAVVTARVLDTHGAEDPTWRFVALDSTGTAACAAVDFEPSEVLVQTFDWDFVRRSIR